MGNYQSKAAALFVICLFALSSCSSNGKLPQWIVGKWETKSNQFKITEHWKESNNEYQATTVWDDGRKKMTENVRLFIRKNDLIYHVEMADQSIEFVCSEINSDTLVFTNFQNDFPKYIVYARPSNDLMNVWIGNSPDDPNKIQYPFKKIQ